MTIFLVLNYISPLFSIVDSCSISLYHLFPLFLPSYNPNLCILMQTSSLMNPNFWLKFFAMNCCCGCSIHDIDYNCYRFNPKVIWQILLIQHCTCYFYNVHVFPFSNFILLWGITTWILPLNSLLLQVFTQFIWKVLSPSIRP
jgi:hypothetical protein